MYNYAHIIHAGGIKINEIATHTQERQICRKTGRADDRIFSTVNISLHREALEEKHFTSLKSYYILIRKQPGEMSKSSIRLENKGKKEEKEF